MANVIANEKQTVFLIVSGITEITFPVGFNMFSIEKLSGVADVLVFIGEESDYSADETITIGDTSGITGYNDLMNKNNGGVITLSSTGTCEMQIYNRR